MEASERNKDALHASSARKLTVYDMMSFIPSGWLLSWRTLSQIGFENTTERGGERDKKEKEGEKEEKGRRGANKQLP